MNESSSSSDPDVWCGRYFEVDDGAGCVLERRASFERHARAYFNAYYWFRVIFIMSLPCAVLIVVNTLLIGAIRTANARRQQLLRTQRAVAVAAENDRTTMMLVATPRLHYRPRPHHNHTTTTPHHDHNRTTITQHHNRTTTTPHHNYTTTTTTMMLVTTPRLHIDHDHTTTAPRSHRTTATTTPRPHHNRTMTTMMLVTTPRLQP